MTHACSINAVCSNTAGGYNCSCKEGYVGNGTHCEGMGMNFSLLKNLETHFSSQTSMNVERGVIIAISWPTARTHQEGIAAHAQEGMLAMEAIVEVCS